MSYVHPNTNVLNSADKLPVAESVAILSQGDRPLIVLNIRVLASSQIPYLGRWSHDTCEYPKTLYFQPDIRSFRNSACRFVRKIDLGVPMNPRTVAMIQALENKPPNVETMFELGFAAYLESGIVDVVVWVDQALIGSLEDGKLWLAKVNEALLPVARSRQTIAILPPIQK